MWQFVAFSGRITGAVAIVSLWQFDSKSDDGSNMLVQMTDNCVVIIDLRDVLTSCLHRRRPDGLAQVLLPSMYRSV